MLKKLDNNEVYSTKTFGCFCPYWTKDDDGNVYISDCFEEISSIISMDRSYIDPVAVISLLQFNYIHGNRTLVKGIYKIPWRATLTHKGEIIRNPAIPHGCVKEKPKDVAFKLKELLLEELKEYTKNYQHVHILLSGGLDSRVTAGILHILQKDRAFKVTAVTWGLEYSRDVEYAKRIAKLYDWELVHIPINPSVLRENIFESCRYCGSEIAGLHLHGMKWFKNLTKKDLVLATSFGDSIGRGEFSGKSLKDVTFAKFQNHWNLVYPDIYKKCLMDLDNDRKLAFENTTDSEYWALCELDLQENYMRRMIAHAMGYITQWTNLEQVFTSDAIVKYIWSLDPKFRTTEVYKELFKIIDMDLYAIPWARNGISFDGIKEQNKNLTKNFHEYDKWLRSDLHSLLNELINNGELNTLNIFDMDMLHLLWSNWTHEGQIDSQIVLKLAQIEILRKKNNLKGVQRSQKDIIKYNRYGIIKRKYIITKNVVRLKATNSLKSNNVFNYLRP